MNYELAKQLKDAGFKQEFTTGDRYFVFVSHPRVGIPPQYSQGVVVSDIPFEHKSAVSDWIKSPTLSELIEACGKDFDLLKKEKVLNENWMASGNVMPGFLGRGKTPLIAVAKLWLKLHGAA